MATPAARTKGGTGLVTLALVLGALALGLTLRTHEILSTEGLGAEDPYTHVVFTKEALERGRFGDSFHLGTQLYPPGIHALAGTIAPLAGVSIHDFARFAPLGFSALAILGMYALGARLSGATAGVSAALLTATVPELVFRTELFFPTALDLALLPLFILLFLASMERDAPVRRFAAVGFLLLVPPLAFTHPWVVPLFAGPLLVFAGLRALRVADAPSEASGRLLLPAGLAVLATAFAMATRWSESDTGFSDLFAELGLKALAGLELPPPVVFALVLAPLALLAAGGILVVLVGVAVRRRLPPAARTAVATAAGVALLAFVLAPRPPLFEVDHRNMLGLGALLLAFCGGVVSLFRPSALGDLGLAIALALFPLTALDLFGGIYWPQRTVAYLAVGVVLLAAVPGVLLARAALRLPRLRAMGAPAAILVALLVTGSALAVSPAKPYGWYRLYGDEDLASFAALGDRLGAEPGARVVVFPWQPALLVKAHADPDQARYTEGYFRDEGARRSVQAEGASPLYVLVDAYLLRAEEKGTVDLAFLGADGRHVLVDANPEGRFRLYEVVGR